MKKVIYGDNKFLILEKRYNNRIDYMVVRKNMPKEYHAHFNNKNGARTLIKFYWNGRIPKSEYLINSLKRILTKKELTQRGVL